MGKNLYITTAIPYVNGAPHIGHALDYLLADIWTRYQKQNGRAVRFQAGTDEHGSKIAAKATELNLDPKTYTDQISATFQSFIKTLGVEYTDFVRTTDPHHEAAVQWIWQKLQPYIYKGTYEGWYCTGHEAFFTDKEVEATGGVCPDHQKPYEHISEENYYLKASAFTDKVREAIEHDRMKIVPEFRKKNFWNLSKTASKTSVYRGRKKACRGQSPFQVILNRSSMCGWMHYRII